MFLILLNLPQGIAMDPNQEFLFAAGEDAIIRGWSIQTGHPLSPSSTRTIDDQRNPFLVVFPNVIESMQVIMEHESMCLWAACDKMLFQFHLGQRWDAYCPFSMFNIIRLLYDSSAVDPRWERGVYYITTAAGWYVNMWIATSYTPLKVLHG